MFYSFLPEIVFSIIILMQLLFNIRLVKDLSLNFPVLNKEIYVQTLFIIFCIALIFANLKIQGFFSNLVFLNDENTRVTKIIVTISSLLILNSVFESFRSQKLNFFEFFILFSFSILSLFLVISSCDLISFYICIEMQSLCFYILAAFKRNSSFSTEAGLKYFISGSFFSGFFLFGASLIYGCLGTLNLNSIFLLVSVTSFDTFSSINIVLFIGIFLVTSMLLFKIACAPFHFWAPDVYEGSPLSSTIIFSVIPKVGVLSFFIKWYSCLGAFHDLIDPILLFFGLLSVFIGTFFALSQKRVKRLIIYSSIAQVGFIVSVLSLNTFGGYISLYFFLILYIITSILIWSFISISYSSKDLISYYYSNTSSSFLLSNLSNYFAKNWLWTFSFIITFFSIGGIPPLAGFLSKIYVFFELIDGNKLYSSIFLIIISAISVYYYIRVIKIIFFEPNLESISKDSYQVIFYNDKLDTLYLILAICLFLLIFLFFYPNMTLLICQYVVAHSTNF